ncbi:MAG: SdrD B-like domain-containing protein [Limnochordia bacterium]|jgi:hypothetical protein
MRLLRFIGCLIICMVLFSPRIAEPAIAELTDMDTSVVRLDINERKFSESFELYDDGEAILLPLLRMGQLLDANVSLDPLQLTASVIRSWDGLEGIVDLQRQVYYWGGEQLMMSPEAQLGPGDFFVPVAVVERLMDVQILWRTETQTLMLTVDRQLSLLRPVVEETAAFTGVPDEPEVLTVRTPPMVSLGTVQYVLKHESITQHSETRMRDDVSLSAHWQIGGIPVDVVIAGSDIASSAPTWELKRATATYRSPSIEVVAGDTSLSLGRILQSKAIRGLRLAAPSARASGVLHAVTTVEGWVVPGSEVELRVNGAYFGRQTATEGYYAFINVPLQITRANRLEIVITEPSGIRRVETRLLTATPRLLPAGTWQTVAGGGWIRSGRTGEWDSTILGASALVGVNSRFTVGGELARQVILYATDSDPHARLAGSMGIAFRASDGLVFALDWLASQPQQSEPAAVAQGVELTGTLRLGSASLQSMIYYREPDLYLFSPIGSDAQGVRIIGEFDLSQAWNLQMSYDTTSSVKNPHQTPKTTVGGVLQWIPTREQSMVLRVNHRFDSGGRFSLAHHYSNMQRGLDVKSESEAVWQERSDTPPGITRLSARSELVYAMGQESYLGFRYRGMAGRPLSSGSSRQGFTYLTNTAQIDATWMPGSWYVFGAWQMSDARDLQAAVDSHRDQKLRLDVSRMSGIWMTGVSSELTHSTTEGDTSRSGSLVNSVYAGVRPHPTTSLMLGIQHTQSLWSSVSGESTSLSLRADGQFKNGFYVGALGRVTMQQADREYYLGVTLSQGIGFSETGLRGFPAVTGRPLGYVTGVVYIDSNGNGRRDSGEKGVPGISVALAGRRTVTDQNGRYCFEFVYPGTYRLGLDLHQLPADYTPQSDPVIINLPANANLTQDFAVSLNGTIEGTVFVDLNGDGMWQPDEPRPGWVKVVLDGTVETFTDKRGNFIFNDVNLGRHELTIPQSSLVAGLQAPGAVNVEITEERLDAWNLFIPLSFAGN